MKPVWMTLFLLFTAAFCYAISVEDVIQLSKLQTKDDLIVQMIQKEGLDQAISSDDVVRLKQNGVSDRVIDYMWKLSHPEKQKLLRQEGESTMVGDNIRSYKATTNDGKQVTVFTNVDEKGKRMGGEAPPQPEYNEPQEPPAVVYQQPRYVQEPGPPPEPPQDYYVVDRYSYPSPYDYEYYNSYIPYYPYNSYYPNYRNDRFHGNFNGSHGPGHGGGNASLGKPWQRPSSTSTPSRSAAPASAGQRKH